MPASGYRAIIHVKSLRGVIEKSRTASASRIRSLTLHTQKPRETHGDAALRRWARMLLLCQLKRRRFIAAVVGPHREDDPDPNVGKRSHNHGMAFAFSSFALVIGSGPRFALRTLPGELLQGVAQGFDTPQAAMRFGIRPALKQDGRGATQRLQTAGIQVAAPVITNLCQQSRGQMVGAARQAGKDLVVRMGQKKGADLLIILSNLLDQRQQLTDQRQHQTRLGASSHRVSLQLGLLQLLEDGESDFPRMRMPCLLEHLLDLLNRGRCSLLWRGVGLQEQQRTPLVQFAKEVQSHRVIGYASGGELIDQARLHLDQAILIAREQFQFGHLLAVRSQTVQIGEVSSSCFRQQVRINQIGLGSRGSSPSIHRARIDRVDRPASFQQLSNQQAVRGFNDAGHLLFRGRPNDLLQKGVQLCQSLRGVTDTKRSELTTLFINDQGVMMIIRPVNSGIPHHKRSSRKNMVPEHACPYTVALEARLSHDRFGSGTASGKRELSQSVEPGGATRLSPTSSTIVENKCTLVPALCREGLFLV
jgi:hypothetical protein